MLNPMVVKQPAAAMNLANMPQLLECRDVLPHDRYLAGAVIDTFYAYWSGAAGINRTLVILEGYKLNLVIKDGPVFFQKCIHLCA